MSDATLSARQARRIALKAQGLLRPAPATPADRNRFRRLVNDLGAIQIDSVNVLTRSHYLPGFSRLGPYARDILDTEAWGPKPSLFEYWGHEASLMPVGLQPLFRWRMERARAGDLWSGLARFGRERADFVAAVLRRIETEGPLSGGDFAEGPRQAGWWNWSHGKRAMEWLFWAGLVTTQTRRGFERVYDLPDRVLPRSVVDSPTPTEAEAQRELIRIAAVAMGVATSADLRDYFRMPVAGFASRLAELVEEGALLPVAVESWQKTAFMAPSLSIPRRAEATALLSPFDNLIWRRERAERLFGTRIRLEIYTPAHLREHGYYVLPFLMGDRIVARVDLKADRTSRVLRVQAAHLEPGEDPSVVASALALPLAEMADWLHLSDIAVIRKGDLSAALSSTIGLDSALRTA